MRLGKILVSAGLLSPAQLSEALARQATTPGRLGTHVIQLGMATADQVALALSKQHQVPPALGRHFENHDPKVATLVGPKVAVTHSLLPIAYSNAGGRKLVICFRDPNQPALIARLQSAMSVAIRPCVASELAIAIYLDQYFGVRPTYPMARTQVGAVDVDLDEVTPTPALTPENEMLQLVDLDHEDVAKAGPDVFVPVGNRRSAIRQAVEEAATRASIEVKAVPKAVANEPNKAATRATLPDLTLSELLSAIEQAEERSAVGDSIMQFLQQRFAAGMMFTIKDGLAMGHRGFGGHLNDEDTVAALMLPLDKSILGAAYDSQELWRGNPEQISTAAQKRFLKLFDMGKAPGEVVVAPVAIGSRVVCLLYAHGPNGSSLDEPDVEELKEVADATQRAFSRIITKARKQKVQS